MKTSSHTFPVDLLSLAAALIVSHLIGILLICMVFGLMTKTLGSESADAWMLTLGFFILPAALTGFAVGRYARHHVEITGIAGALLLGAGYAVMIDPHWMGWLALPLVLSCAVAGRWLKRLGRSTGSVALSVDKDSASNA